MITKKLSPSWLPSLVALVATVVISTSNIHAQCTQLVGGLRFPLGITQTNQHNLIVAETGARAINPNTGLPTGPPIPNTGRISAISLDGVRRTLIDGLPSGANDIGDPSGPAGLFMRGRTLYVAIGLGDVVRGVINPVTMTPFPGIAVPNPNPPSSPIFSSVLAIHFSADTERISEGFTLTGADYEALAAGQRLRLSNGGGDKVVIYMIADFPNYIPNPVPNFPNNVRASNPFDLIAVDDRLYVTDGGRNLVWSVDITSGAFSALAEFPPIPNPLFNATPPPPSIGGPTVEAVPTGIDYANGQLLVTLFRGFPFPAGTSVVEQIDPTTGNHSALISGRRTAIDILALEKGPGTDYLLLEHSAAGGAPLPPFGNLGQLLHFDAPQVAPTVIVNCLTRPTSMVRDTQTGTIYVTEYSGRVVVLPIP